MFTKQEQLSKFFLPPSERYGFRVENEIIPMYPDGPCCQDYDVHKVNTPKVPFAFY
jgi:hypothetical protein